MPRVSGFPNDPWGIVEIAVGLAWGSYVPFRNFSSEFDCTSEFMGLANFFHSESKFFDGGLEDEGDWMSYISPILTGISTITSTVGVVQSCMVERDVAIETKWYEIYDLKTETEAETEDGTQSSGK